MNASQRLRQIETELDHLADAGPAIVPDEARRIAREIEEARAEIAKAARRVHAVQHALGTFPFHADDKYGRPRRIDHETASSYRDTLRAALVRIAPQADDPEEETT